MKNHLFIYIHDNRVSFKLNKKTSSNPYKGGYLAAKKEAEKEF